MTVVVALVAFTAGTFVGAFASALGRMAAGNTRAPAPVLRLVDRGRE